MPRKPRFFLPDVPVHAVQRGNNRQAIFFDENDYRIYLDLIRDGAVHYGCAVHAYVLMTNHVHLLLTPHASGSVSALMQWVGRYYVPYVNHTYGRSGTLWEGRFKASLVQEQHYLLACYRYIELNPVRAGMVESPEQYPWSSHRCNALGDPDRLVTPHGEYRALGESPQARRAAYRALFGTFLDAKWVDEVRACLQTGTPLGNDRFREQIEQALDRKVGNARRGRPRGPVAEDDAAPAGQLGIAGL